MATIGALVASRRPGHPVGWLLAFGLSLSAAGLGLVYPNYGVARAGAPPAAELVALYLPATIVTAMASSGLILLLTPTGGAAVIPLALVGAGDRGHAGRLAAGRDAWFQAR